MILREADRERRAAARNSMVAAVLLTGTKAAAGLATGSLGVLSEALHSALDMGAAGITYLAVRVAGKPADAEHRYGHGKVESFAALAETVLLLATCLWIIQEAIQRLFFEPVVVEASLWAFAVMVFSILVDYTRSRQLYRVARKYQSQALEADALHFSSDMGSSAVVILGLVGVRLAEETGFTPLVRADALAALIVAAIVIGVGVRLGKRTVDILLDRAPPGLVERVEAMVARTEGVIGCHRVRVRRSGADTFVDMSVTVDRLMPVETSHGVASQVEERVQQVIPGADVLVHIEPVESESAGVMEQVRALAGRQALAIHEIRIHEVRGRRYINYHLEVNQGLSLREAHDQATHLEKAIQSEVPGVVEVTTHIEPLASHPLRGMEAPKALPALLRYLPAATQGIPGLREWHDVTVRRVGARLFVSLHCLFDGSLSIEEVHRFATQLEERLKSQMPEVESVLVHAEPAE